MLRKRGGGYSHSPRDPRLGRRGIRELSGFNFGQEVQMQRFLHGNRVLASRNPRLTYPEAFGTTQRLPASDQMSKASSAS